MSNNSIIHSGTSTADADRIFSEMFRMTISLLRTDPRELICSKDNHYRWYDLAEFWTGWANDNYSFSLFEMALHHIYWGVYPDYTPENIISLLTLIENELLSDSQAYNAWKKHMDYTFGFNFITSKQSLSSNSVTPKSKVFRKYLASRFCIKVVHKGTCPNAIRTAGGSISNAAAIKNYNKNSAVCVGYEKAIHCLIPDSKNWTENQWLDEQGLYRELQTLYGVNFQRDNEQFDHLIIALSNKLHTNAPIYLAHLLKIDELPIEIAKRIWPNRTDTELKKLFMQAASRAKSSETRLRNGTSSTPGSYAYDKLNTSWLYKYVYNDLANKSPSDAFNNKVKIKLLDASLRI